AAAGFARGRRTGDFDLPADARDVAGDVCHGQHDVVGAAVLEGVRDARRAGGDPFFFTRGRARGVAGDFGGAVAKVPRVFGVVVFFFGAFAVAHGGVHGDVGLHAVEGDGVARADGVGRGEF